MLLQVKCGGVEIKNVITVVIGWKTGKSKLAIFLQYMSQEINDETKADENWNSRIII